MRKIIASVVVVPLMCVAIYARDFSLNTITASNISSSDNNGSIQPAPAFASKNTNDAYDFSVKPGTEKWKAFDDSREMLKACQVPEQILRKMSTAGLVKTVMNQPLFWSTIMFHTKTPDSAGMQWGFNVLVSQFNGIQELLKRRDAGTELLLKYRSIPLPKKEASDTEIGDYLFYCYSFEILFAQGYIRAGLTETQLEELRKELLAKYEIKKALKSEGGYSRELMELNGLLPDSPKLYNITVPTPKGYPVEALQMQASDEMDPKVIAHCNQLTILEYPKATWEASCTQMYNCHSYAWYNQATSNTVWIDGPNQAKYWEDGSYVPSPYATAGMKLSYSNDNHSAVFVSGDYPSTNPTGALCRSKWGNGPLMLHPCGNGKPYEPYNAVGIVVYRLNVK